MNWQRWTSMMFLVICMSGVLVLGCGEDEEPEETSQTDDPSKTDKDPDKEDKDKDKEKDKDDNGKTDGQPVGDEKGSIPGSNRTQGIFATVNGEQIRATIPFTGGFIHKDYELNGFGETIVAEAFTDQERKNSWKLWVPSGTGSFGCNDDPDNDGPARLIVQALNIHTQHPFTPEDCSFEVDSFDIFGVIEGRFSGKFGSKVVTDGRFYFDNARGGGDCSDAAVINLQEGDQGATLSVMSMTTTEEVALYSAPKTVRCGQNYVLKNGYLNQVLLNPNMSSIFWEYGITLAFSTEENVYFDSWGATLNIKEIATGPDKGCYDVNFADLKGTWCDDEIDLSDSVEEEWVIRYNGKVASGGEAMVIDIAGEIRYPGAD